MQNCIKKIPRAQQAFARVFTIQLHGLILDAKQQRKNSWNIRSFCQNAHKFVHDLVVDEVWTLNSNFKKLLLQAKNDLCFLQALLTQCWNKHFTTWRHGPVLGFPNLITPCCSIAENAYNLQVAQCICSTLNYMFIQPKPYYIT